MDIVYIVVRMMTLETLESEWHEGNEKAFSAYGRTSHIKALWRCSKCGHEWQATKSNRVSKGSGCPKCRKQNFKGSSNPKWTGYGEISGKQWSGIRRNSIQPFEITIEYAWELFLIQNRKCVFTGRELTVSTASLDCIDLSKGYVEGNVRWIDKRLNNILPDETFIALCQEVAAYQTKKELEERGIPSFTEWKSKGSS
jgi:hypothetical protein